MEDFFFASCSELIFGGSLEKEYFCLMDCLEGAYYRVYKILDNISLKNKTRLLEFGFLPGRKVCVIKKSPLKKTLLLEIFGYVLSLRCDMAHFIAVTK